MGMLFRFSVLLVIPLSIGSVWAASATASVPEANLSDFSLVSSSQPYEPPDNGGPDGTTGSGIR